MNGNRCDKVALRTTNIKNVKFKIIKTTRKGQLLVSRIFLLQRKPKLGRTKPSTKLQQVGYIPAGLGGKP